MASVYIFEGSGGLRRRWRAWQWPGQRRPRWHLLPPPEWRWPGHRRPAPPAVPTDLLPASRSLAGACL